MNETEEIILCIPGPWESRTALIQSLFDAHQGRYLFAGMIALDTSNSDSIAVDLEGHHPEMRSAFHAAGLNNDTLDQIDRHQLTAYLHFPLDLPGQRQRILDWASVFERAGGIAIKVESTGLSHSWQRWHDWMGSDWLIDNYKACTILAGGINGWYSCGMHLFGKPDAITSAGGDEGRALLDSFNRYNLIEEPELSSGQSFATDQDAPKWTMTKIFDERFSSDNLFYNALGLWRLERPVEQATSSAELPSWSRRFTPWRRRSNH